MYLKTGKANFDDEMLQTIRIYLKEIINSSNAGYHERRTNNSIDPTIS